MASVVTWSWVAGHGARSLMVAAVGWVVMLAPIS